MLTSTATSGVPWAPRPSQRRIGQHCVRSRKGRFSVVRRYGALCSTSSAMILQKATYRKSLKRSMGLTRRTCSVTAFEQFMSPGKGPQPCRKLDIADFVFSNLLRVIASLIAADFKTQPTPEARSSFEVIGRLTFQELSTLRHRGAFTTVSQTLATCCQLVHHFSAAQGGADLLNEWYQVNNFLPK